MNALTGTLADTSSLSSAGPLCEAQMARVYKEHAHLLIVLNAGLGLPDDSPLGEAYNAAVETIAAFVPTTLAGVIMKARAAKAEARAGNHGEKPGDGWAPDWAWDVVCDLIRLADAPSPDAAATLRDLVHAERGDGA